MKGEHVKVVNTTSKNFGRRGVVQRFIKSRGTYLVYMDDDGQLPEVLEVQPGNIKAVEHA